jgi:hypothetical protein
MTDAVEAARQADNRDYRVVYYEGGQHVTTNAGPVNRDPDIYDLYTEYADVLSQYGDMFAHYCHSGVVKTGGAWGAKEDIGQSESEAHKYRALKDWAIANGVANAITIVPEERAGNGIKSLRTAIYPNPMMNQQFTVETELIGYLRIIDMDGRLQHHQQIGIGTNQLDVPALTSGIYFVVIENEEGTRAEKLIVQ